MCNVLHAQGKKERMPLISHYRAACVFNMQQILLYINPEDHCCTPNSDETNQSKRKWLKSETDNTSTHENEPCVAKRTSRNMYDPRKNKKPECICSFCNTLKPLHITDFCSEVVYLQETPRLMDQFEVQV